MEVGEGERCGERSLEGGGERDKERESGRERESKRENRIKRGVSPRRVHVE